MTVPEKNRILIERITKLSEYLAKRLDTYPNDPKTFETEAKKDAQELKTERFGTEILQTLAYIYEQKANQYSGGLTGFLVGLSNKGHSAKETLTALSSMKKLEESQQKIDEEENQDKKTELEKKLLNDGLEALWKVGKLEIEDTVQKICDIVLSSPSTQKKRIEALKILAKVFKQTE